MIAALVNASLMLAEPSWLEMAQRAFAFIARTMTRGDRLGHSWRQGQLKFPGLASDFAAMIRAALALYEATGQQNYLDQALVWQHALDRDYSNAETGTYYLTAADAEGLVIRPASTADEATPNHNAVAAQNLIRLALLTGDDGWRQKADRLIARDRAAGGRKSLHAHGAAQCRRSAVARRRDRGDRGGRRRRGAARRRPRAAAARPHRASRCLGGRFAAGASGPRPRSRRREASRRLLSASARPARCRSPIATALFAPSPACDIVDATVQSAAVCALWNRRGRERGRSIDATGNRFRSRPERCLRLSDASAAEWCGYASHAKSLIECGYSSDTECESAVGKGGMCFVDPEYALNAKHSMPSLLAVPQKPAILASVQN